VTSVSVRNILNSIITPIAKMRKNGIGGYDFYFGKLLFQGALEHYWPNLHLR